MKFQSHTAFAPLIIRPVLAKRDRKSIERQVEELIAILDDLDGDCDLEDDDPSATAIDDGEAEGDWGRGLHRIWPSYGSNQARGPTNYRHAELAHHRAMLEAE